MQLELNQGETPMPVVDLDRMEANIARTTAYAREQGVALRPHVKTHKSPYVAALQLGAGATGVTCATPREAEVMRTATDDIMLAYPTVGAGRAVRIARLARDGRLRVMLDSLTALDELAAAVDPFTSTVGILVELDIGMQRTGIADADAVITVARRAADTRGLEYLGVGFYPGHIRAPITTQGDALAAVNTRLARCSRRFGTRALFLRSERSSTPDAVGSPRIAGLTRDPARDLVLQLSHHAAIGAPRSSIAPSRCSPPS